MSVLIDIPVNLSLKQGHEPMLNLGGHIAISAVAHQSSPHLQKY